jgi:hypothetical protein
MKDDYDVFKQVSEARAKQTETDKWLKKRISTTYIKFDPEYAACTMQFPWPKNNP